MIGAWVIALVVAFGLIATRFGDALTSEFDPTNGPESKRAEGLIEDRLRGQESVQEAVLIRSETLTVEDGEFRALVESIQTELLELGPDFVASADTFYSSGDETLVSENRSATVIPLVLAGAVKDAEKRIEEAYEIVDGAGEDARIETFVTGDVTFAVDFSEQAQKDSEQGEIIGVPIALLILAAVFGAVGAALLPIALAIIAIAASLGVVSIIGEALNLHVFTFNIITMIGLAVGIDYSLFIVSRYREELRNGLDKVEAIATAGRTASRAVFFSGATVVFAPLGMLIIPHSAFFSLGLGAILVVLLAVVASLTLLPAPLSVLGGFVNRFRVPFFGQKPSDLPVTPDDSAGGVWDRISYAVMRRPVVSLILGAGLLIAAAVPYLTINTSTSGVSTFPQDLRVTRGFVALQEEFGASLSNPAQVVTDGDIESEAVQAGIEALRADIAADEGFGLPSLEVNDAGDLALLNVPVAGDPESVPIRDAVTRLRDDYVPAAFGGSGAEVLVGGQTAIDLDFVDLTTQYQPIVFAIVLALSFVLLTLVFRSIVVPIKAIILNLLSVGAACGLLVLVFQHGVGAGIFGFEESDGLQPWLPLFLFTILFGLSMDYHVFLLSRIRERYDETRDNAESVAFGVRSTAGLITGAALIMVAVFGGFASGELVQLQQMGFGLAVAVLIDATIVRTVLVPASMKLLGDRNWYLPSFLEWLPDLRVEGPGPQLAAVAVGTDR